MTNEHEILATLEKLEAELTGFVAAAVVDLVSGMALGAKSRRADFDLDLLSAFESELVKQKLRAVQILNLNTPVEDMLVTLGDQLHLVRVLSPSTFLILVCDRATTNQAIMRAAVARSLPGT
jgi:hypothetical protein